MRTRQQIGVGIAASLAFFVALGIASSASAKDNAKGKPSEREPYQYLIFVSSSTGGCTGSGCDVIFPEVPAGKRLVVQQVSARQILFPGFINTATLRTGAFGETDIRINLIPHVTLNFGGTRQIVTYSQQVFGYIEAGVAPYFQSGGGGHDADSSSEYFISGYLEPAPSVN